MRAPQPEPEPAAITVIAPGSRVHGTIAGGAETVVEGQLDGRAEVEGTFVVGPRGKVQGDIKARVVRIAGSVQGNVEAVERVELLSSGRIEGDVLAPRVAIAEGGFCQGRIEMTRARAAAGAAAAPQAAASPRERGEPRESAEPRQTALEGARSES